MGEFKHWLSPAQQRVWRDYLAATAKISERLEARLRPFGLDLSEYEILVSLSESPDHRMRMSDLAAAVNQSRSRLTHTISRMERAGLVHRANCPVDKRGVNAELTPAGFALIERTAPDHVLAVREVLIDVVSDDEFHALGAVMRKVLENLD